MELPSVGQQCEDPTCKQLDFLPLKCKCNKVFCSEHYAIHIQECATMKEHFKVANLDKKSGMWICSHPDCKEKSLVPLICEKCHQHFCVAHRHVTECYKEDPSIKQAAIAKMQVPIAEFNAAKAKVDQKLDENLEAATKKGATNKKKSEMAMKVQLMRVKNKATGLKSIPTVDRIYFNVTTPKQLGEAKKAVFVSKTWSVGRAIDAIADECKVPNRNNVANAEKLRLFTDIQNDTDYIQDLSKILNNLVHDNQLVDGQNLKLEYVQP